MWVVSAGGLLLEEWWFTSVSDGQHWLVTVNYDYEQRNVENIQLRSLIDGTATWHCCCLWSTNSSLTMSKQCWPPSHQHEPLSLTIMSHYQTVIRHRLSINLFMVDLSIGSSRVGSTKENSMSEATPAQHSQWHPWFHHSMGGIPTLTEVNLSPISPHTSG